MSWICQTVVKAVSLKSNFSSNRYKARSHFPEIQELRSSTELRCRSNPNKIHSALISYSMRQSQPRCNCSLQLENAVHCVISEQLYWQKAHEIQINHSECTLIPHNPKHASSPVINALALETIVVSAHNTRSLQLPSTRTPRHCPLSLRQETQKVLKATFKWIHVRLNSTLTCN